MILTENELLAILEEHGISFQRIEHPPVYTCDQAEKYRPGMKAVSTKNLFMRDKKGTHFYLVMTACEKRLDIKQLSKHIEAPRLHFGSEEMLLETMGVTPGAVTALGILNDQSGQVELLVDADIWDEGYFLCHPLVNTATLVLKKSDLLRFFEISKHTPRVVQMPEKQPTQ
jgi:Ala-tRNA(Pro) deacylase